MEGRKIVFKETLMVLVGQAVCIAAMIGIYALLGRFSLKLVYSAGAGGALAVFNFFFMAVGTSLAVDKAQQEDVKGGKALIQVSSLLRYGLLFVILFACGKSGLFALLPLALPLVFVRPILAVGEFFRKKGDVVK